MTAQNAPNSDLQAGIGLPGQAPSEPGGGRKAVRIAAPGDDRDPLLRDADLSMLRALHDGAPDVVLAVDGHGRVGFANAAAKEVLGWEPAEIEGASIATLVAGGADLECVLNCLRGQDPLRDRTLAFQDSKGSRLNLSASSGTLALGSCSKHLTMLHLRDIGERLRREADLVRSNDELEHCINALAHDLRSPLVALLGFSRLLRQDYDSLFDETARHFLDRIEQAGHSMENLVHDLLELSRVGTPNEPRMLVDPRPVLIQIEAELKHRLDAGGLELVLPADPPMVLCDRTPLYQVLSNLIGNAIEHSGAGRDEKIWINVRSDGEHDVLSVSDRGRGIPEESHERIFEAFQSLSSRGGKQRGAGIGLAIVKKIAETHGGRAWVESELGKGSTFHVAFPNSQSGS